MRVHLQRVPSFTWDGATVELRDDGFVFAQAETESLESDYLLARVKSSGALLLLPRRNTSLVGVVVEEGEHAIVFRSARRAGAPRPVHIPRAAITLTEPELSVQRPVEPVRGPAEETLAPTLSVGRRVRLQLQAVDSFVWGKTSVQVDGKRITVQNGVLESRRKGRLLVRPPAGPWLFVPRRSITLVGSLLELEPDAIRIGGKQGREWILPRAAAARWEVSIGKVPAPAGPRRRLGGALGLAAAGIGALLLGGNEPALLGAVGMGAGAVAGGAAPGITDQWAPVEGPR